MILWTDLETTGLNPTADFITEVGCIIENKGLKTWSSIVKPPFLPEGYQLEAGKVTGLTQDKLNAGISMQEAADKIEEFVAPYVNRNNKFFLAGKNIDSFDKPFIQNLFKMTSKEFHKYFHNLCINVDTLIGFCVHLGLIKTKSLRLGKVAEAMGIELINAHSALDDIEATRQVYYACLELLKTNKQEMLF